MWTPYPASSGRMSRASSSSDGGHGWPKYGPVPLTRCPNCPQLEPLVRLRCKRTENGNYGREFVKCESRPQPENILKKCTFFMWIEDYIEKLHSDGGASLMGALEEMVMSNWDEQAVASRANMPANLDMFAAELKKINYNLSKIVDLKKQENYIVGAFCASMFIMGLLFLMMNFVVDTEVIFVLWIEFVLGHVD